MIKQTHHQNQLDELKRSYDNDTKRIQALRKDIDTCTDSEHRVTLEARLLQAEERRNALTKQIEALEAIDFEVIDEELSKTKLPRRSSDLREISNYVIVGLNAQSQLRPILEMFSSIRGTGAFIGSNPEFEEIPFEDFGEMTDVFTSLTRVLNRAKERGGSESVLMTCLKEEVIDQASEYVVPREAILQPTASQSFGVEYMIWSVHKEWASVIRALRIKRILSGEVEIKRTSENEIAFDDIRRLQLMATTLQEAAVAGKNSPQDFLRLVLQGAMRAQLMDLS